MGGTCGSSTSWLSGLAAIRPRKRGTAPLQQQEAVTSPKAGRYLMALDKKPIATKGHHLCCPHPSRGPHLPDSVATKWSISGNTKHHGELFRQELRTRAIDGELMPLGLWALLLGTKAKSSG
ncbi:hypothetical protein ZEAMMB73_Zm00001d034157 [Zea mays]|nr:hypothetical protein ZEAMMB73_Zm00001d034157 [Zea mays]